MPITEGVGRLVLREAGGDGDVVVVVGKQVHDRSFAPAPAERAFERVLVALRWAGLAGMLVVLLVRRHQLDRPVPAVVLVLVAIEFTAWATWARRHRPWLTMITPVVVIELAVGAALQAADGWVLGRAWAFAVPALGSVWPLAGIMAAGAAFGPAWGAVAGTGLGLSRLLGALAPFVAHGPTDFEFFHAQHYPRLLPAAFITVLYALAGVGAGAFVRMVRAAEAERAASRSREDLARTLHDGVLQTLAIVERRSTDPALVRLARDTDRDLRSYLYGGGAGPSGGVEDVLRRAVREIGERHDLTPEVVVVDDLGDRSAEVLDALTAALGETLVNVAKHAHARHVTICAAMDDDGVLVTVKDDGIGFDADQPVGSRQGISESIRARMVAVGGRAEVRSAGGWGTEVSLWLP